MGETAPAPQTAAAAGAALNKIGNVGEGAVVLQGQYLTNVSLQLKDADQAKAVLDLIRKDGQAPYSGPLLRKLDPIVLVNRAGPLAQIGAFFADEQATLLYVHGMAGMGKSTLVRGAIALRQTGVPTIWLACAGLDAERLARELCQGLGLDQRLLGDAKQPVAQTIAAILAAAPAGILVLDGFEVLLDDEFRLLPAGFDDAMEAFATLEHRLRILVTTRQLPFGAADGVAGTRILHLGGLAPDMAANLLRQRAPKDAIAPATSLPEALMARLAGNPKFIELAGAALAELSLAQVAAGVLAASDLGAYVKDQILARLAPEGFGVLRSALVFRDVFAFEALQAVFDGSEKQADIAPAVRELVRRAVLDTAGTGKGYYLHPVLRDAVDRTPEQEAAANRAAACWFSKAPFSADDTSTWDDTLYHLRRAAQLGGADDLGAYMAWLLDHDQDLEYAGWGRRVSNEMATLSALPIAPGDRNTVDFILGQNLWNLDDTENAITVLDRLGQRLAAQPAPTPDDQDFLFLVKAKLGNVLVDARQLLKAIQLTRGLAALADASGKPQYKLRYRELRFNIARRRNRPKEMLCWAQQSLECAQQWVNQGQTPQTLDALAEANFALAISYLRLGDGTAMTKHFVAQLRLKLTIGKLPGVASTLYSLGSVLRAQSPPAGAACLLVADQLSRERDFGDNANFRTAAAEALPGLASADDRATGRDMIKAMADVLVPVYDRGLVRAGLVPPPSIGAQV